MLVHNQKLFRAGEVFLKLGHFDKYFLKKSKIESSAAETFRAFDPRYS